MRKSKKVVSILFPNTKIYLKNLQEIKVISKRKNCEIIHYKDSITLDSYIGKRFKPIS